MASKILTSHDQPIRHSPVLPIFPKARHPWARVFMLVGWQSMACSTAGIVSTGTAPSTTSAINSSNSSLSRHLSPSYVQIARNIPTLKSRLCSDGRNIPTLITLKHSRGISVGIFRQSENSRGFRVGIFRPSEYSRGTEQTYPCPILKGAHSKLIPIPTLHPPPL